MFIPLYSSDSTMFPGRNNSLSEIKFEKLREERNGYKQRPIFIRSSGPWPLLLFNRAGHHV